MLESDNTTPLQQQIHHDPPPVPKTACLPQCKEICIVPPFLPRRVDGASPTASRTPAEPDIARA